MEKTLEKTTRAPTMKNRLEYKLDLLTMEGQGFNRTEIVQ
jgi:hypothetical protein